VEKSLTNIVCYNLQVDNIGTNEAKENGSSNEQAIWLVAAR